MYSTLHVSRNSSLSIDLKHRRIVDAEPDNVMRNLELAAYLTHCQLYLQDALCLAIDALAKTSNQAHVARFAKKPLELKSYPEIVARVRLLSKKWALDMTSIYKMKNSDVLRKQTILLHRTSHSACPSVRP